MFFYDFDILDAPIHVSIPIFKCVIVTFVHHAYSFLVVGFKSWDDLVILDMTSFDVIIGMT